MASFTFHLRRSKVAGSEEGRLFIRIIHARLVKEIPTSYTLKTYEWDAKAKRIVYDRSDHARNRYLAETEEKMHNELAYLRVFERDLAAKGEYTAAQLGKGFLALSSDKDSLMTFCDKVTSTLIDNGQLRTARAYRSTVRSLSRYYYQRRTMVDTVSNDGKHLRLEDINSGTMRGYEEWLRGQGLEKNSISFYMRNLRALYYRAVDEKVIRLQPENPFAHVYTGVSVSQKRALDAKEIGKLRQIQRTVAKALTSRENTRSKSKMAGIYDALLYFDFCLEARGMSWVDMVTLRKDAINGELFTYRRQKTKGELNIIVTPKMKNIIAHFAERTKGSPYVFPVIHPSRGSERRQYESGLRIQNERLAEAARMAGIDKKVTTHVSRHSWATIAKREKIEIALISELLGHSNIEITNRYLASFDQDDVARATEQVANALKKVS
jgi:integrase